MLPKSFSPLNVKIDYLKTNNLRLKTRMYEQLES